MNEVANIYGEQAGVQHSTTTEMVSTRQMQEVQGQIVMAKNFPAMRSRVITAS